jgi:hypothetical protein
MTNNWDLRPLKRLAKAKRFRVSRLVILAATAGLVLTALLLTSRSTTTTPAFLTKALGAPQAQAPLQRKPARDLTISIDPHGYTYSSTGTAPVGLTAVGLGGTAWKRYEHGTLRSIDVGHEAVTVRGQQVEHLITVDRHAGRRVWQWRLNTKLEPRLSPNGTVAFFERSTNRLVEVELLPAAIYDPAGRDVTPKGTRWQLAKSGRQTLLQLSLDDAKLPLPYTIDPIAARANAVSTAAASGITATVPSTVQLGDLILIHVATQKTSSTDTNAIAAPTGINTLNVANAQNTSTNSSTTAGTIQKTFWKRAARGDESKVVTATWSTAANIGVMEILVYKGVKTSAPVHTTPAGYANIAAASTNFQIPTLSTTQFANADVAVGFAATNIAAAFTTVPAGTTPAWTKVTGVNGTVSLASWNRVCATAAGCTNTAGNTNAGATANAVGDVATFAADATAPTTNGLAVTGTQNGSFLYLLTGASPRLYYKAPTAASTAGDILFNFTATPNDDDSGVTTVLFPVVAATTGFTGGSATAVAYPTASATWTSSQFKITNANTAAPTNLTITSTDNNALTKADAVAFTRDITAPTGGAVSVAAFSTSLTLNVNASTLWSETQSTTAAGLSATAGNVLTRSSPQAPTSPGVCPTTGYTGALAVSANVTVAGNVSDTVPTDGRCYVYTLTGNDNVSNTASVVTAPVLVDTTPPTTPTVIFSGLSAGNTYDDTAGTLYFRPSAGGTFTVNAASSDPESGLKAGNAGYTFGALNTNGGNLTGTQTTGALAVTFTATSTGPTTARTVVSTNGANASSATANYNVTQDSAGPINGAISVPAFSGTTAVTITTTSFTDALSGVNASGSVISRSNAQAPTSAGVCPATGYTGATTVTSPDTVPTDGQCYVYTLNATDRVGNPATPVSSSPVLVDTTQPAAPTVSFSGLSAGNTYDAGGGTLFFRPSASGAFTVTAAGTDAQSAIKTGNAGYTFGSLNTNSGVNFGSTQTGAALAVTFDATTTGPTTARTVLTTNNANLASPAASYTLTQDSTAPTGGTISAPAYSTTLALNVNVGALYAEAASASASGLLVSGGNTLTRTQASPTAGVCPGSGYGSTTTISANLLATGNVADTVPTNGLCYVYTLTGSDHVGNTATAVTSPVLVDTTPPATPTVTFSGLSPSNTYDAGGGTLFFRPSASGTFTVNASSSDGESGLAAGNAAYTFGALNTNGGNLSGTQTNGALAVTFTSASTGPTTARTVSATNKAGSSTATTYALTEDSAPPTGGAVSVPAYSTTLGLNVNVGALYAEAAGASASGLLVSGGNTLTRTQASPTAGVCPGSGYGSTTTISANLLATGNLADTVPTDGLCYVYTLTGSDRVGNTATAVTSPVLVDTTAPAPPTVTFSGLSAGNTYATGTTLFFGPSAGTFTVNASSSDGESGLAAGNAGYTFGALNTDGGNLSGTQTAGALAVSFDGTATGPTIARTVHATNKAGSSSAEASYTLTRDAGAPTGGTISVPAFSSSTSVTVTVGNFTDALSGMAGGGNVVTRSAAQAPTSAGVCPVGGYSGSTVVTSPDTVPTDAKCYVYTLTGTDRVGNPATVSSSPVLVDTTAPAAPTVGFSGLSAGNTYASGSTLYFRPSAGGTFTVDAVGSDAESAIKSGNAGYSFGALTTDGGNLTGTQAAGALAVTFTGASTGPTTARTVATTNNAGSTSPAANYTVTEDHDAPTGGAISVPAFSSSLFGITISSTPYGDALSGIATNAITRSGGQTPTSPGVCPVGGYSGSTSVTSPDTVPTDGRCYVYTLTGTDHVGNFASVSTAPILVDGTAPAAPTVTFSGLSAGNTYATGTTLYFRPSAAGAFTVNASSSDAESGLAAGNAAYTFDALNTNGGANLSTTQTSGALAVTFTGASAGPTTARNVTATNKAGATSNPTAFSLTEDSAIPTGGTISVPAFSSSTSVTITAGNYTDALSGIGAGGNVVTRSAAQAPTSPGVCPVGGYSGSTIVTSPDTVPTDSRCYVYTLTGTDRVGNPASIASAPVLVDAVPPSSTVTFPAAGSAYTTAGWDAGCAGSGGFCGTASDPASGVAQVHVSVKRSSDGTYWNGSAWSGTTENPNTATGTTAWSYALPHANLTDGLTYTVHVYATDAAGNVESSSTWTFRYDTTPPTVAIATGPQSQTNATSATFTWTPSEPVSGYVCKVDGGSFASCASGDAFPGLAEGPHTFQVKAVADTAGNAGTATTASWTVDLTAPTTTLSAKPTNPTNTAAPSFTFGASEGVTGFECSLDGAGFSACTSPKSYAAQGDGPHTFQVKALADAAGNAGTTTSYGWTVDTTAPVTTISAKPATASNVTAPVFSFGADETVTGFECKVDSGSFAACASGDTFSGLAEGAHTFQVKALADTAGNAGAAASYGWTIDTTAPVTTIATKPASTTASTTGAFTFTASESVTGFVCQIDGGAFTSCTSGESYTGLAEGAHTFAVKAVFDDAGNAGTAASYGWAVDLTAPDTAITAQPATTSNDTSPSFSFSSADTGATFQCRTDGGTWSACTSPKGLTGLTDGSHTFEVRATDAVGNVDATPATRTWTVDTAAPTVSITGTPGNPTNATGATFAFNASESGSTFECALDSGSFSACSTGEAYTALAQGSHTFHVRARDAATNLGAETTLTWTIDLTAPVTTITSAPASPTKLTSGSVVFGASEASTFQCRIDAGTWSSCSTPASYSSLADGAHTVDVRATDTAGNAGNVASASWTVDTQGPTVTLTSQPQDPTNATSASFSFTASESGSTYLCDLDNAGFQACSSGETATGLADGSHTFKVKATDLATNTGAVTSYTWTVDRTTPVPSITAQPADPTNATSASFSFSSSKSGTFECSLDSAAFAACTSPKAYTGLAEGNHTFRVQTTDTAGNAGGPASYAWRVDTSAPTVALGTTPSNPSNDTAPAFDFTASETGSTFLCSVDGGTFAACSSALSLSGLAAGSHTLDVKARDLATNTGPPTNYTWTIDLTAPTATVDSGPANPTKTTSASFAFSASETATFQCQLDSGGWSVCSGTKTYAGPLGDGSHTFEVKATDVAQNAGAAASFAWVVDTAAPTVTVSARPANPTNATSASFSFASPDGGTSFECALDSGSFSACSTGESTSGLAEGTHTFHIRATDAALNTGAANDVTWRVDTTAPTATISAGPASPTNATAATFQFGSSETGSTFACALDGGAYTACTSPSALTGVAAGSHTYHVKATDPAGNESSAADHSWTVDLTAPTTTIATQPADPTKQTSAAFTFSADETATFECKLDGAAYAACATGDSFPGLSEGAHAFRVRAQDTAGNTGVAALATWTVDTTAPSATITTPPASPTNATGASFSFTSSEAGSFECRLDGAAFAACSTGQSYSGLAQGAHTFHVRAVDQALNTGAADTATWTVDTTAPTASISTQPAAITNATAATFSFGANEAGSTFLCDLDGAGYSACTDPKGYTGPLGQGSHTFKVTATDPAGNESAPATYAWTVDTTAPTTTILTQPGSPTKLTTASFTFSASESATFACKLDGGAFAACTSGDSFAGLAEGAHTLLVKATDAAANEGPAATASWTVDTTAPTATIGTKPAASSNDTSPTFTFSSSESGSSFLCDLDGGGFAACSSPSSPTGLSDGAHTFRVKATDAADNTGTAASYTWTVDTQAPTTTISSSPQSPTAQTAGTVQFGADEAATFLCRIDGGTWTACTSPVAYSGLLDGAHTVEVKATDAAGNTGTAATAAWTVDTAAPTATIGAKPFSPTNALTASLGFTASESGSSFQCRLDGGAYQACSAPKDYTGLSAGAHTFDVKATDAAGNTGNASSYTWTIDRTDPVATIDSGPTGRTNATTATFAFTADETSTFECKLDTGSWTACATGVSFSGLGDATHTLELRATDTAGNTGAAITRTWVVDTVAPVATLSGKPALHTAGTSGAFFFSADEPATFLCALDGATAAACSSGQSYGSLAEGAHTFVLQATDTAGTTGTAVTYTWDVDTTAPTATIGAKPAALSSSSSASFGFSAGEPGTFECSLDGAAFAACGSPEALSSLADGAHTFAVKAIDLAGNASATAASYGWTVDTTAPAATILTHPNSPTNQTSATFTFSASETGVTYQCDLDGAGYAACSSGTTYTGLLAGSHTVSIRPTDAAGNVGSAATRTWTVDLSAPNVSVTSGPASPTNATSAALAFTADAGTTVTCALDSGSFAACSSPVSYGSLADGAHTVHVKATNGVGTPSVADYSWTVDTVAPTAVVSSSPASPTKLTTAQFSFGSSDGGTAFQCAVDGGAYAACVTGDAFSGIAEGAHTFHVQATDAAGNTGTSADASWTVDLTAPSAAVLTGPAARTNSTSALFDFSASELATYECKLDGGAFAPCSPTQAYAGPLAAGAHTFQVRATDAAGNTGTAASHNWTIDLTPPTATVDTPPASPTNATGASIGFSANETATFQCAVDGGAFALCSSPKSVTGLGEGSHTFHVKATDQAGNEGAEATATWTVDLTPPTATVSSSPASPTKLTTAQFTFGSADGGTSFQCAVDGAAFAACSSPETITGVTEGAHVFHVKATDAAGNTGTSADASWTVDLTAPTAAITSAPTGPTQATSASFDFGSTDGGTSFECALDAGAFAACTSPKSYSGLADATHAFHVRATDAAGNTGTAATATWRVDTTAPAASITSAPAALVATAAASFAFASSETGSSFQCSLDAGAFAACTTPNAYNDLADGSHTFHVKATDAAGNTSSSATAAWTVDTTAPTAVVSSSPASPTKLTTAQFSFGSSDGGTAFQCAVDGGAFAACTSPQNVNGIAEGAHTFHVQATDAAGNTGTSADASWTVDLTAPSAAVLTGPAARTNSTSALFDFSASELATYECKLDGGAFAPCSPTQAYAGPLAVGVHTFEVRATDAAGNTGTAATHAWTIDLTPPTATVDTPPASPTNATGASIGFSANETATFQCAVDGGAFALCSSPKSVTGLGEGSHTFHVKATDQAGNEGAEATATWTVDLTPPTATVSSSPASPTKLTSAQFTFGSSDGGTAFQCAVDGAAFATCSSPQTITGVTEGSHTFHVKATDAAGNTSTSTDASWTVDLTAPTAAITSAPTGPTQATSASFDFGSTDGGTSFECALDAGAYASCTSPKSYSGLPDATHAFHVRATDAAGNTGTAATATWRVDTTAPTASITSAPAALVATGAASFAFASNETGSSFQCSLDAGAFAACTTPNAYNGLADGAHTFQVKATDAAGNTSSSASAAWTVDTTAPTTTLSTPATPTNATSAGLTFTASETATFECSLDGATFAACTSPQNVSGLGEGSHTLRVRATDTIGNQGTAASSTWTVDLTAPTATVVPPATPTKETSASIAFSASETSTYTCSLDGAAFAACSSPQGVSGLAEGTHAFRVKATDAAGNESAPETATWRVDTTAPAASVTSAPAAQSGVATASFAFDSSETGSTFECALDSGAFTACASPKAYAGLAEGSHAFHVRAIDQAGNTGTAADATWNVDLTAPAAPSIGTHPSGTTAATSATFGFSSSDGGTSFQCALDGGAFAACTTPKGYSGLGEGSHTFQVRATDAAGNTGTAASSAWTIDLTGATATVTAGPASPTSLTSASFSFSAGEAATFECSLDGGAYASCSSPKSFSGLADGAHTFRVRGIDALGNVGTPAAFPWTVDTTAPALSIDSAPNDPTNTTTATFAFTADPGTIECRIDGGAWLACSSPATYTNVAAGSHTFSLRDTNGIGTTSTTSHTWRVDLGAPTTSITTQPANVTSSSSAAFTFAASEPVTGFQCSLDGGGFSTCSSPQNLTGLPDGAHTFAVRAAADLAGNAGAATSFSWTVDTTAPVTTIASHPATPTNQTTAAFTFAASEGVTGFQCRIDGGSWTACATPAGFASLADGPHTVDIRAVADAAGNPGAVASFTWTVDTVKPVTTIASGPTGTISSTLAAFTVLASEAGRYECALDLGGYAACASPQNLSGLADGTHAFHVRTVDAAGNVGDAVTRSWTVDTTPPVTTIGSGPNGLVNTTSASFGFATEAGATTECAIDAGAFSACASPATFSGLAEGPHTLRVRATDLVGNAATVTRSWTVDTVPPAIAVDSMPANPTGTASGSFAFTAEAGATSECRLDTGAWAACSSPAPVSGLADGAHTFTIRATDPAGNTATAARTWTVDTTAPAVAFTSPSGQYVAAATPLAVSATDSGTGVVAVDFFECSTTGATCTAGGWNAVGNDTTAPYGVAWPLPGDGTRAVRAVATDAVGRTATATLSVVVDQTAPTGTLADPGPYLRGTVALSALAEDATSGVASVAFQVSAAGADDWKTISTDGDAAYGASLATTDTALVAADGNVDLRIFVTDKAGNVFSHPLASPRLVDNTPPTAAMTAPPAYVTGTVGLVSTQSDAGSGIDTVTHQYRKVGDATWTATPAAWDTTALRGAYELRTVVLDRAGNETDTTPLATYVDHDPPVTNDDAPAAWQRTAVTVHLSSVDPLDENQRASGVDHSEYSVDGGPYVSGDAVIIPAPIDHTWDGTHAISYRSIDVAGNLETAKSTTVKIDTTPPSAAIADTGTNLRNTITLASTTADSGSGLATVNYEISPAGQDAWTQIPSPFDTHGVNDGPYDFRVVAVDNAGNGYASPAVQNKLIDNTAPATTDNAPGGSQATGVTVTLTAADTGSGVQKTEYKVDGGAAQTGTTVTVPAPADHSNDGEHTIKYWSTDVAGNVENEHTASVVIDTTPPSGPVLDPGAVLSGTVELSANPSDADIASVKFQVSPAGAGTWTTIATVTARPYTTSWNTNTAASPDGSYDLRFVVTDRAGNSSPTVLSSKTVDNTGPTAAVTAPVAGAKMAGTVNLSANASDGTGSGVVSVAFQVKVTGASSFTTVATDTASPWTTAWDSRSAPDGPVELRVIATDVAGNTTTSGVRTITADNNPPTVALADVSTALSGFAALNVTTSADTASVTYQRSPAGAGVWTEIGTSTAAPFGLTWTTTTAVDGTYDLRAVATDGSNNRGTSPVVNVRVDNTAPAGSLTKPTAAQTVGGPNVELTASATDTGAGVAFVRFEWRASAGTWAEVATDTSTPYAVTWDPTAQPSGAYELRAMITDAAGNAITTPATLVSVDTTPPTIGLGAVPASLGGSVDLGASTSGGTAKVVYAVRASSAAPDAPWTPVGTATTTPWSVRFDTNTVPDGVYDVRGTAFDAYGNSASDVKPAVRVDNVAPSLVSSEPADGAQVPAASSVVLTLSEEPSAVTGSRLDGNPVSAPTIAGSTATYSLATLAEGEHDVTGTIVDGAGHTRFFRVNFTVWSGTSGGVPPAMWKNSSPDAATTITSADGTATINIPAGAYSSPSDNEWMLFRVGVVSPTLLSSLGLSAGSWVYDITARWVPTGEVRHQFDVPLDIQLATTEPGETMLPRTYENGAWRLIPPTPVPGVLPPDYRDGFYVGNGSIHVLTRHLTMFTLVKDMEAPEAPQDFGAGVAGDGLTLRWNPGRDNSGVIKHFTVFVNGEPYVNLPGSQYELKMGAWDPSDTRQFFVREVDAAGNVSASSAVLVGLPRLIGQTLDQGAGALAGRGFTIGKVTYDPNSTAPSGTIIAPDSNELRAQGSTIDVVVSGKTVATTVVSSKLTFDVVGTKVYTPAARNYVAARIKVTKPAQVVATLYSPKHVRLYTWRRTAHAGAQIFKLTMPAQIRRSGIYTLVWTARSGDQVLRKTQQVRVAGSSGTTVIVPPKPVEIVLAGSADSRNGIALGIASPTAHLIPAALESTFTLAGNTSRNVGVVIVDVDRYGVGFVKDLRTLFPSIRLVAVASNSRELQQAARAGATLALPKSTSAAKLGRAIRGLAGIK